MTHPQASQSADIVTVRDFLLGVMERYDESSTGGKAAEALAALNRLAAAFHARGAALVSVEALTSYTREQFAMLGPVLLTKRLAAVGTLVRPYLPAPPARAERDGGEG